MCGWVSGFYSDIKTNLSQVRLDWDWPTGLGWAIRINIFQNTIITNKLWLKLCQAHIQLKFLVGLVWFGLVGLVWFARICIVGLVWLCLSYL